MEATLIDLPEEIQEKIFIYLGLYKTESIPYGRLPRYHVINYSMTNKKIMHMCDNFFRRKAQLKNIPLELLPESNIVKEYIKLNKDIVCANESHELSPICCFLRAIIKGDLHRVKWLASLTLSSFKSSDEKLNIYIIASDYAFYNDKDIIGEWLIDYLSQDASCLFAHNWFNIINRCQHMVVNLIKKNKINVIYYVLDKLKEVSPRIKRTVAYEFLMRNDLDNLNRIIKNYSLTIHDYHDLIVSTKQKETLELLLSRYQGTGSDLNIMVMVRNGYKPSRDLVSILIGYGFNDYLTIINRVLNDKSSECVELVKFLLLKYGHEIPVDSIRAILPTTRDDRMKKLLYEHISNFNN